MTFCLKILRLFILFGRNAVGCINKPYITYRKLAAEKSDPKQTIFIYVFVLAYFIFAALIRSGFRNPYILTVKFNSLVLGGFLGFLAIIALFVVLGKILSGKANLTSLFILWSYSLLPTLTWFSATSVLYLLLPPPRTLAIWGKAYSIFFVTFSLAVLFWKLILYYLTLRFGLRFGMGKIIITSIFTVSFIGFYSILMYQYRIFRIPFI